MLSYLIQDIKSFRELGICRPGDRCLAIGAQTNINPVTNTIGHIPALFVSLHLHSSLSFEELSVESS